MKALIKEVVEEIALNKSEYESAVDDVVDEIYQYAKKYPDINPSLENWLVDSILILNKHILMLQGAFTN